MKVLVTTYPFNASFPEDCEVVFNTKGMKYTQEEIQDILQKENPDIIIAGTEKYTSAEFDMCPNLKVISRVGIGTSSIDLDECKKREIKVRNTPDAPTNAVVELTLSLILSSLKKLNSQKMWDKVIGKELNDCTVGIVGYGRIGKKVYDLCEAFGANVMVYDPYVKGELSDSFLLNHFQIKLDKLYSKSDIISFHTSLIDKKITHTELNKMKDDVILINTSRGNLLDENDLYKWLKSHPQASAALDVFENEPYVNGDLCKLDNIILTPHIGSYTTKARKLMEKESVQNIKTEL